MLDIANTCIAPTQSLNELVENLESIGLRVATTNVDTANAAQFFSVSTVAENVPLNSEAFDWSGQLNIDAQRLLRVLKRGDTKNTRFRYFALKSDPENIILLVQRWNVPGVKYENQCRFVAFNRKWTEQDRNDLLAAAVYSNAHADGFQSGILNWTVKDNYHFDYVSISFFDFNLFNDTLGLVSDLDLPIVSLLASVTRPDNIPNLNEVQQ